jgi:aromatic-L-amino-acid/L-tryptophan decarboxylase
LSGTPGDSEGQGDSGAHMSAADFRRHGHALIDWIAEYLEGVEDLPVLSQVAPGEIRRRLPAHPPERGEAFEDMLADVDDVILPGLTHWQSPRFFAYFPANSSYPSILGELLSAGLGVQGMLWATSPAVTELETHVLDWLLELLGLPDRFRSDGAGGGVIQDTASSAALCALLAARERATGGAATAAGVDRELTCYASAEAHSSIEKAVRIAGHGTDRLRLIPGDAQQRMDPRALASQMAADRAAGAVPCMVVATVGTTSSTAIDPVAAIADVAAEHGAWLHVDAAMAGSAAVCPELRWIHDGVERADSYCFNPHKWLFTNFDCDAFWVADRDALIRALSVLPEYLRNEASATGKVIDYRDWQIPLGRRFRALKLWFVLRHYGAEGLRRHIRAHVALAQDVAQRVRDHPRFELAVEPPLNLVCFRHVGGDEVNQRLLERLNASGRIYLTHTRMDDALTLRLSVGQTRTEQRHVDDAWDLITHVAAEIAD